MQKKLLTLAVAVAVLALHMPAAEAVNLGSLGNIGAAVPTIERRALII